MVLPATICMAWAWSGSMDCDLGVVGQALETPCCVPGFNHFIDGRRTFGWVEGGIPKVPEEG